METKKAIQISFVILLIESVIALIYGFCAFILPEFLTSRTFPLYTEQSWESLFNESPQIANYILIIEGAAGGMGFTTILGNLFVLLTAYRQRKKWAWYYVLVVSISAWLIDMISNIMLKNYFSVIFVAVGLVLLVCALVISAKAFLIQR